MRPGDWVLVWGQVQDTHTHPDDVTVEMFSHNAQFQVNVRRDRVNETPPPEFALRCPSLYTSTNPGDLYLRCRHLAGHSNAHENGGALVWADEQESGRIEGDK